MTNPLVVYVDVDDTLVRSVGTKRIPIPATVAHVRELFGQGAQLDAWSSGGGDYARATAVDLGIADCFSGFLPKPNVVLDDMDPSTWPRMIWVHPLQAPEKNVERYRSQVESRKS